METNFNFKSQPCTSREQSKRLLVLGLKKETADCYLFEYDKEKYKVITESWLDLIADEKYYSQHKDVCFPAWSLHRLWELLGKIKKYEDGLYPCISLVEDNVILENPKSIWVRHNFFSSKGVYENIINCFEELIKEGYFNKEYLV